jgi:arylsulfatase A-like enzyme/Flp pilus assembly protein TadD
MLRSRHWPKALLWAVGAALLVIAAGCNRATPSTARPALPKSPDIVLITIDTLRADSVGFLGNRRVETPALDRLASQGLVFTNAHAHNVVTLPSHVNILTGLYPYQHGVRDNTGFRVDARIPTLATWLKQRGYATGAFVGAFPLDSRFGLARGFDVYDDRYPKGRTALDFEMPERPAAEVIAAAQKWYAQSAGRPRFLWVHLYDCHAPYRPPPPFDVSYRDNPYLGEVAAVDSALKPLLDLFLSGQAPPTLVVVTSDHGEALGDHQELTHGLFAYEATLHVPLVVWMRGAISPGRSGGSARHVDIAPTILAAAGIGKPGNLPGSSLLNGGALPDSVSYFEAYSTAYNRGWAPLRGVISGGFKLIDLPAPELYDLSADPGETRNLIDTDHDRARRLQAALTGESRFGAAPRGASSAEEVSRLRSLGYLSGNAPVKERYSTEDDPKNLVGVDRQIHDAIDLYQRGDLAGAVTIARTIVSERPTMSIAYESLGFLLRQAARPAEALAVYRDAVSRGIANEELKSHYGLALCEAGRPAEAVQLLSPLSQSEDPDTLNALGVALADSGRAGDARGLFQRVLALDPENVEAYGNLGIVRLRSNDAAGARDFFRKALDVDPRYARAWNGLGVALAQLSDERGAIESWEKAVTLDPRLYDALFNLGLTAGKNGLQEKARRALERFVATAPPVLYRDDIVKARGLLRTLKARPA